jgi:predicted amidohydrolase YtcJ
LTERPLSVSRADLDELCAIIQIAHDDMRPVAFRVVSTASLLLALTALEEAGVFRDRLEHAAELPDALLPSVRDLDVPIVTQPGFLRSRR